MGASAPERFRLPLDAPDFPAGSRTGCTRRRAAEARSPSASLAQCARYDGACRAARLTTSKASGFPLIACGNDVVTMVWSLRNPVSANVTHHVARITSSPRRHVIWPYLPLSPIVIR